MGPIWDTGGNRNGKSVPISVQGPTGWVQNGLY